ncbi:hypothetical protein MOJ79_07830 [Calidifontimicrobium sp. SYSU G02091]|jgi:hypothetical protein|uniref:hypothetical protein n=1 Tax=Calidifontimicrobium sp. SYSU G02091 TaxID=2926421 RepID=UPI001F538DA9|nr:hypothetical protein [Calidifontimicrobium sp. SYSU G02091]MCI1191749.1 hypothetical protein [Calidifontimicrobium sp. SYSU G02091]
MTRSRKTLWIAALALGGALAGGAAHARGDVYWSLDISAPGYPVGVGVNLSNAPRVVAYPAPVVVAPPPVVYAPPPVVYAPHPVYVAPRPVVYAPPVYVYERRHWKRGHRHDHHRHRHGHDD